jgi:hypothetical protein
VRAEQRRAPRLLVAWLDSAICVPCLARSKGRSGRLWLSSKVEVLQSCLVVRRAGSSEASNEAAAKAEQGTRGGQSKGEGRAKKGAKAAGGRAGVSHLRSMFDKK